MMTEEEAKKRWCPFTRVGMFQESLSRSSASPAGAAGINRNLSIFGDEAKVGFTRGSECVASACMAWRQTDNKTYPCAPGEPERPSEPAGYCGLAGRPTLYGGRDQ